MDARITTTWIAKNVCELSDLVDLRRTLDEMVRDLIFSEGLIGIADLERIVSVEDISALAPAASPPESGGGAHE